MDVLAFRFLLLLMYDTPVTHSTKSEGKHGKQLANSRSSLPSSNNCTQPDLYDAFCSLSIRAHLEKQEVQKELQSG